MRRTRLYERLTQLGRRAPRLCFPLYQGYFYCKPEVSGWPLLRVHAQRKESARIVVEGLRRWRSRG